MIFLHKSKVDGLKEFVQNVALFFWFDTFEEMSFFQQYFLAKGGGLGFWWLAFPIHFWSYFNAPHSFLASELKKVNFSPGCNKFFFHYSSRYSVKAPSLLPCGIFTLVIYLSKFNLILHPKLDVQYHIALSRFQTRLQNSSSNPM